MPGTRGRTTTTDATDSSSNDQVEPQHVEQLQVEESQVEPHPCQVCPVRSIAQNESFGYCEGCTSALRWCRSCEQHKPQTGWGWGLFGLVFGMIGWLCADCKYVPAGADAGETHPRFITELAPVDERTRYAMAEAVSTACGVLVAGGNPQIPATTGRIAEAIRGSDDGAIDVDVSNADLTTRNAVEQVLHDAGDNARHPDVAQALRALRRAWIKFVDDCTPTVPARPEPTIGERSRTINDERWL